MFVTYVLSHHCYLSKVIISQKLGKKGQSEISCLGTPIRNEFLTALSVRVYDTAVIKMNFGVASEFITYSHQLNFWP